LKTSKKSIGRTPASGEIPHGNRALPPHNLFHAIARDGFASSFFYCRLRGRWRRSGNFPKQPTPRTSNENSTMEKIESLEDLFIHELKDVYNAEKQLVKALPKVARKASSPELKEAIEEHLQQTEEHVNRLEEIFEMLDQPAKSVKCKGMEGILEEGEESMKMKGTSETLDAAIIMAAQKVEHYEIASYGSLATWADLMGRKDIKRLLGQTLEEEEETDQKLTELAESGINQSSARKAA
jgi:ferritin-like metal-binding protein YciE